MGHASKRRDEPRKTSISAPSTSILISRAERKVSVPTRWSRESDGTLASVAVRPELPGTLHLSITERVPVLAWQVGAHRYAVDGTGLLIAEVVTGGASASDEWVEDHIAWVEPMSGMVVEPDGGSAVTEKR